MIATTVDEDTRPSGLNGWLEAALFCVALAVLNITYAIGHQMGAHPVAFLAYAMITAALMLLAFTGIGPDWRKIVSHPLSFAIGGGIILMEATYFMLMRYVSPADASLLVRLNVPLSALLGYLVLGRGQSRMGLAGLALLLASILLYIPVMSANDRPLGVLLGITCGVIMSSRWLATEFHPANRAARTVIEKMRLTGLVLLVTSIMGAAILVGLMLLVERGSLAAPAWLPTPDDFLRAPTIGLGWFTGILVLTTMQYLGFSCVPKIRAENFVATTAFIPLLTAVFQVAAVALGILAPMPMFWTVLPPMLGVIAGVMLVIWSARTNMANS